MNYNLTNGLGKGYMIHTFTTTSPKVNILAQVEFELAYYDITVQLINLSATKLI